MISVTGPDSHPFFTNLKSYSIEEVVLGGAAQEVPESVVEVVVDKAVVEEAVGNLDMVPEAAADMVLVAVEVSPSL